jgi:hypothetical protein
MYIAGVKIKHAYGITPFCLCSNVRRHIFAAVPGLRRVIRTVVMAVRSTTLPAWCAAARGIGTRYMRVDIPSKACRFTTANVAAAAARVTGGSIARKDGFNVCTYSHAVPRYVDIAWVTIDEGRHVRRSAARSITDQNSVIELHSCRVFKYVPPQV